MSNEVDEEINANDQDDRTTEEMVQPLRRSMRENAGKGVERTHPYVQFAMAEKKSDNPKESCIYKRLVKVLFIQVLAKEGIKR